jgi:hypothetical protein
MISFKRYLEEKGRCWTGYKPVRGKKAFTPGSCVKEDELNEMGGGAGGGSGGSGAASAGPTNTAGGGNIAGIGVGKQGEPGVDLRKRKKQHADPRLPMGMGKRKDF